jgi:tetratricopeptide (TPR) repeat protein
LGWFWQARSHDVEGRQQLESALAAWPIRDNAGARGRLWAGYLTAATGEPAAGQELLAESLAILKDAGDDTERADVLEWMGWAAFLAGDYASAEGHVLRSLELRRELGRPELIARSMHGLCQVLVARGNVDQAEPLAQALGERGASVFADCALLRGQGEAATGRYRRALELAWRRGSPNKATTEMDGLAMAAVLTDDPDRALRLAGAAAAQRRRLGIRRRPSPWWDDLVERSLDSARGQLGRERAETAWEAGWAMDFEQAVKYALGGARATEVGRPG